MSTPAFNPGVLAPLATPGRSSELVVTRMSDVKRQWPTFLYPGRVPDRDLTIIAGDPGLGKSTWTVHLASMVTRGELGAAGSVLFALGEDGTDGVFHGRLEAAGAVMEDVHVFEGGERSPFYLPESVCQLAALAKEKAARLVVIDPLDNYLSPQITPKDAASIRSALKPLKEMAQELRLAVLLVVHLNKGQGQALYRVSGSLGGLTGTARSTLLFTIDPDDPEDESGRRALGHIKCNWGQNAPTEIYQHESVVLPDDDGNEFSVSRLIHRGDSEVAGSALLTRDDDTPESKRETAGEVLADVLGDGQWHRKSEVAEVAKRREISVRTLDRAASEAEVERKQEGMPAITSWRLPSLANPPTETLARQGLAKQEKSHSQADNVDLAPQPRHTVGSGETGERGEETKPLGSSGAEVSDRVAYWADRGGYNGTAEETLEERLVTEGFTPGEARTGVQEAIRTDVVRRALRDGVSRVFLPRREQQVTSRQVSLNGARQ